MSSEIDIRISDNHQDIGYDQWENFVCNHPQGNFFQSPRLHHFVQSLPGYKSYLVTAWQNQDLVGLFQAFSQKEGNGIKGYLSRRTIVYGGPLTIGKDGDVIARLLIHAFRRGNDSLYTEFRNLCDLSHYKNAFIGEGYRYQPHLNYIVDVQGNEQQVLQLLNSTKRRQVRKSLKNGAEIILARNKSDVRGFYDILKKLYRRKVKKPLPPWQFFEGFYESSNLGVYLLVLYKQQIVGGIMCPVYDQTLYEWYVGGEDGIYPNIYPSVLATYAALQYVSEKGYRYFDFLGAGQPGRDYGVRQFKSQFGGREVEYGRFFRINKPLLYRAGKFGYQVSRSLFF